ncbi:putative sexual development protein (LsdA) [Aspergillus alliaceus]|uniref:putative sexual development protein (LsdA) n=1 Tax=Petromyces alliaceus TaxID=209559 RepID=UPI0012A4A360|nr:uncharacterized protein BDW43DRAFT_309094 [Aspergillus alliaceus]KAB8235765.1 hypothetical protein BDW43DRAFT_309094 [Aspergillus alliaceus]
MGPMSTVVKLRHGEPARVVQTTIKKANQAAREYLREELGPKHLARKWDGVYRTGGNILIVQKALRLNPHPKESNCLKHFIINPIQPCRYQFPIADFDAAIALAATFTGILLGTLQDVVVRLAGNNDVDLTRVMAATIGNEGE